MRYASLYVFYIIYYAMIGAANFLPKFYGEIGMTDGQIGLLTSIPTLIALVFSPMLADLADRSSKKRHMLTFLLIMIVLSCFLAGTTTRFLPLLAAITLYYIFVTPAQPLATTISLEYSEQIGRPYGPIRLFGTIGYQIGALLVGALLSASLRNIYPFMGVIVLISTGITFLMPNIEGHQHSKPKVSPLKLFADRHVLWLYVIIFFAAITTQFYMSFFTKHLGDLGMDNATVSWITMLSVMTEIPFLAFADRIYKKTNIWNWLIIGMAANGIRWLGLAVSKNVLPIVLFQILGVTDLACFQFFPALYLNQRVSPQQTASAQNTLNLTIFGAGKIVGSLIGGQICDYTGIPAIFAFCGVMLVVLCVVFWIPTRRLSRTDETAVNSQA